MKVCYVFPGQGSQSVGMIKTVFDLFSSSAKYKQYKDFFENANQILDFDITDLMLNGPLNELSKTKYCQPAMLLADIAYFYVLKEKYPISLAMGHSVGEYAALVATGAMKLEDALVLVQKRAQFMTKSIPPETLEDNTTHMAAVRTDRLDLIDEVVGTCPSEKGIVQIANYNSPTQTIISGNNAAVIYVVGELKKKQIETVKYLPVEGPFHTKLMARAGEKMKEWMKDPQNKVTFKKPKPLYVSNVTRDLVVNPDSDLIKDLLSKQIYSPVLWTGSLITALQYGCDTFIESGPGRIQTGIVKENYRRNNAKVLNGTKLIESF